ncbi:MAG: hypothetical protein MJH09_07355 [Cetobacterium sp.]|nr:hypothetical protein [Cetobacterium sp.]
MNFGIYFESKLKEKNIKKSEVARIINISRQSIGTNISKWKAGYEANTYTIKKYLLAIDEDIKKFSNTM